MTSAYQVPGDSLNTYTDESIEVTQDDLDLSHIAKEIADTVNDYRERKESDETATLWGRFCGFNKRNKIRVTHTFNCSFCGYSLKTERGMIRHVSRKHTTVSPSRNQTFYMVVEITNKGGRTKRHEIKFLDERLLFYPVQDRDSSLEAIPSDEGSEMDLDEQNRANLSPTKQSPPHDVRWSQLPPGGGFTPTYNINEASTVSQEGLFSYPSTYEEQTILSDKTNTERKGSSGPIDLYNTPYSSLDNQNYFEPAYLSQPYAEQTNSSYLLSQDSEFVQQWV